jgi:hypothetical protein
MNRPLWDSPQKDWPWPDTLDALRAAPAHHTLVLENERVRVIHTHIPVGDKVPLHTHRWPGIAHVISASDFIRRDQEGNVLFDSRVGASLPDRPAVQWLQPLPPHTVENVGSSAISIFTVELKDSDRG